MKEMKTSMNAKKIKLKQKLMVMKTICFLVQKKWRRLGLQRLA